MPSHVYGTMGMRSALCACVLSGFSRVRLCATLWTRARQAPLSTGFSRQEYWSGLPCPPPGDLPDPGMEPWSLVSPALAGGLFTASDTCKLRLLTGPKFKNLKLKRKASDLGDVKIPR